MLQPASGDHLATLLLVGAIAVLFRKEIGRLLDSITARNHSLKSFQASTDGVRFEWATVPNNGLEPLKELDKEIVLGPGDYEVITDLPPLPQEDSMTINPATEGSAHQLEGPADGLSEPPLSLEATAPLERRDVDELS